MPTEHTSNQKIPRISKTITSALIELVEDATKKKRDPIKIIKSSGKQRLWVRSRISDRAVKMLFKELIGAYRKSMNQ